MQRSGILCACLLMANQASAATIVTWQATGSVTRITSNRLVLPEPGTPVSPPVGTPLSIIFSFDQDAVVPFRVGNPAA